MTRAMRRSLASSGASATRKAVTSKSVSTVPSMRSSVVRQGATRAMKLRPLFARTSCSMRRARGASRHVLCQVGVDHAVRDVQRRAAQIGRPQVEERHRLGVKRLTRASRSTDTVSISADASKFFQSSSDFAVASTRAVNSPLAVVSSSLTDCNSLAGFQLWNLTSSHAQAHGPLRPRR